MTTMARREYRARLLAPSFLIVAGAVGCDPSDPTPGDPVAMGGEGSGGTGGQGPIGGSVNPPCTVLPCPVTLPPEGAGCSQEAAMATGQPYVFCISWPPQCHYQLACGDALAACNGATWNVTSCE